MLEAASTCALVLDRVRAIRRQQPAKAVGHVWRAGAVSQDADVTARDENFLPIKEGSAALMDSLHSGPLLKVGNRRRRTRRGREVAEKEQVSREMVGRDVMERYVDCERKKSLCLS